MSFQNRHHLYFGDRARLISLRKQRVSYLRAQITRVIRVNIRRV
nr:hypothetical protein [Pseudanabaena sp. PCC 6802]